MARSRKSNTVYWRERDAMLRMQRAQKDNDLTIRRAIYAHDQARREIQEEIDRLFGRFAEGMSYEEAQRKLTEYVPDDQYDRLVELYQTADTPDVRAEALRRINAEPLKYRIARKEALAKAIDNSLLMVIDKEVPLIESALKQTITKEHRRYHFDQQTLENLFFPVDTISDVRLQQMVSTPWSGKPFSASVWDNTDALATRMNQVIPEGMMQGKSSREIARDLQDLTDMGNYATERLVRTETTYVVAEADKAAAKERGIKQMRFIATLDTRTSERCRDMDNKYIPIDELIPGTNQPPLHPHCRSVLIEQKEGLQHRIRLARDPDTGRNYEVPADMSYREWEKTFAKDADQQA